MKIKLKDGRELTLGEIEAERAAGKDVILEDGTVLKSTRAAEVVDVDVEAIKKAAKSEGQAEGQAEGQKAEAERQDEIRRWGRIARVKDSEIENAVRSKASAEEARERFAKLAETALASTPTRVEVVRDERETFIRAATDGLALRGGWRPGPKDASAPGSEQYRNASLSQIAQQCLIQRGMNPQKIMLLDNLRLMELALGDPGGRPRLMYQGPDRFDPDTLTRDAGPFNHSTSDFPFILGDATNKRLQAAFVETPSTYGAIATPVSRADFKTNYVNRLSEGPNFKEVLENGEITQGNLFEEQEQYYLKTFGRIIGFTRNAIVNDDLRAFARTPQLIGGGARRLVNRRVWDRVKNGTVNQMGDGKAWFSADHENLIAPGTALNAANLAIAKTKMRLQTGMQPENPAGEKNVLNIVPSMLAVPASLEDTATKLLADRYYPQTPSDGVADWIRNLMLVVEPELENGNNGSATAWYLFADPRQYELIELGLLNGVEAPTLIERRGTDILGIEFIAYLDCEAKEIDWHPAFRNDGA
jgi:phage major head subunit gpT-like protein